jgi:hypothetical protein
MKTLFGVLIAIAVLFASGCVKQYQNNYLDGRWRGYITERGKSTLVELRLRDQQGLIDGKLTILSKTGEDIDKGMAFEIIQAERSGNNLKFIVPLAGKVDDDTIAFELLIEGNRLKGHGHELRKGSKNLPVTFTKQD